MDHIKRSVTECTAWEAVVKAAALPCHLRVLCRLLLIGC